MALLMMCDRCQMLTAADTGGPARVTGPQQLFYCRKLLITDRRLCFFYNKKNTTVCPGFCKQLAPDCRGNCRGCSLGYSLDSRRGYSLDSCLDSRACLTSFCAALHHNSHTKSVFVLRYNQSTEEESVCAEVHPINTRRECSCCTTSK
jgi:hypothetical protein